MELVILLVIAIFIIAYRKNNGENIYQFIAKQSTLIYNKYAPYSFKIVREKAKILNQEYSLREYSAQVLIFGFAGAGVAYLYFYSIVWGIFYDIKEYIVSLFLNKFRFIQPML